MAAEWGGKLDRQMVGQLGWQLALLLAGLMVAVTAALRGDHWETKMAVQMAALRGQWLDETSGANWAASRADQRVHSWVDRRVLLKVE